MKGWRPSLGAYVARPIPSLTLANTRVVSALILVHEYYPNEEEDGFIYIAETVEVPTARRSTCSLRCSHTVDGRYLPWRCRAAGYSR